MMLQTGTLTDTASNGAAIILWITSVVAGYFLKQFADGVREMRRELVTLRVWIARIAERVGVQNIEESEEQP